MRFFIKNYKTFIALLIGIVFIVIGCVQHQPNDVLTKAIRICLECVGIG